MSTDFVPYLNFAGTTREAMEFYQSLFGGDLTVITFGDVNAVEADHPAHANVMHAFLAGGLCTLAASDHVDGFTPGEYSVGSHMSLSIMTTSESEGRRLYQGLADGGMIGMELGEQSWGALFGSVHDRYGQPWLINISQPTRI